MTPNSCLTGNSSHGDAKMKPGDVPFPGRHCNIHRRKKDRQAISSVSRVCVMLLLLPPCPPSARVGAAAKANAEIALRMKRMIHAATVYAAVARASLMTSATRAAFLDFGRDAPAPVITDSGDAEPRWWWCRAVMDRDDSGPDACGAAVVNVTCTAVPLRKTTTRRGCGCGC